MPEPASELPIALDRDSEMSLPVQLSRALRDAIDGGTLRPGESLAATRELAARLGVARGVVVSAYEQLIAEGYLVAGHGTGTRVHPELRLLHPMPHSTPSSALTSRSGSDSAGSLARGEPSPTMRKRRGVPSGDFPFGRPAGPLAPSVPDTSAVDTPAWRAAWRSAITRAHLEAPELGDPHLRAEIADHLRRMRGTTRDPDDVIVTAGTRDGLGLLLTALGTTRGRRIMVGVEDPGFPSLRHVAARHGADIVALPVDADGLATSALPEGLLDVVIVTPSHQYPLGGSLPLARRRELLEWAARTGVVIVEDDYDSELRHTGNPLPALAALDDPVSGFVVLLGTFSKTVSQSLSAGFMLAPAGLRTLIEPVRHDLGGQVPAVVQTALAEYLSSGELRRHTTRMRRRYAIRRELVVEKLGDVPGVTVRPMSGGLHAVVQFDRLIGGDVKSRSAGPDYERRVLDAAADLGIVPLSRYWQRQWQGRDATEGMFGLVIGMGAASGRAERGDREFDEALVRLRAIVIDEFGEVT